MCKKNHCISRQATDKMQVTTTNLRYQNFCTRWVL
jgi:hypothetical protein